MKLKNLDFKMIMISIFNIAIKSVDFSDIQVNEEFIISEKSKVNDKKKLYLS